MSIIIAIYALELLTKNNLISAHCAMDGGIRYALKDSVETLCGAVFQLV